MCIRIWAGAVLIATTSGFVWAQRPLVYPLRSQSPGAQSIDNALCYSQARQQTHVDIVREPQRPLRTKAIEFAPDAGRGTAVPPLPPGADRSKAASGTTGAAAASAASAASPTAAASAPTQTAPTNTVASGASAPTALSAASGANSVNLPPLPPPEPPMTRYWQAYGDCMQSRGYGVR